MYELKFSLQAGKFLGKLPATILERIKTKFLEISKDPFRFVEHYEGEYYKIRIGDYRALVDIEQSKKIIWIRVSSLLA